MPARHFPPPWSIEEQSVSNGQMWPYYINMQKILPSLRNIETGLAAASIHY